MRTLTLLGNFIAVLAIAGTSGCRTSNVLLGVSYPVILALSILRIDYALKLCLQEKWLWVFLAFLSVSVLWSDIPDVSELRLFVFLATTMFGVYFGVRYNVKQQVVLISITFFILATLSLMYAVVAPSEAIMTDLHAGAYKGLWGQKNVLGRMMNIGVISSFLWLSDTNPRKNIIPFAAFSMCFLLLILSQSRSALVILITLLLLLQAFKLLRLSESLLPPLLSILILSTGGVASILIANLEPILNFLGKDLTLTGRTELWEAVIVKITERPWIGYGFGGFWRGWEAESDYVWAWIQWTPPHSHNGLLDILLDVGILGTIPFVIFFITSLYRSLVWAKFTKSSVGLWPIMYMSYLFLTNLTESEFKARSILWSLFVAVVISTYKNPQSKASDVALPKRLLEI